MNPSPRRDMERARTALQAIETAIREHPATELANACLDYLNYDRLGKREVHRHLAGGDRELHQWLKDYGVEPSLRLGERQERGLRGPAREEGAQETRELIREGEGRMGARKKSEPAGAIVRRLQLAQNAPKPVTEAQRSLIEQGVGISEHAPTAQDAAFIAGELVLASLPPSNPGDLSAPKDTLNLSPFTPIPPLSEPL